MPILDARSYRDHSQSPPPCQWTPVSPVSDASSFATESTRYPEYRGVPQQWTPSPQTPLHALPTPLASPTTSSGPGPGPSSSSSATRTRRRTPEGHIKRPPNAFMLYRSHALETGLVDPRVMRRQNDISRAVGALWRGVDPKIEAEFKRRAEQVKKEHMKKYPGYKYAPRKVDGAGVGTAATAPTRCQQPAAAVRPRTRRVSLRLPTPELSDAGEEGVGEDWDFNHADDCDDYDDCDDEPPYDIFPGVFHSIPKSPTQVINGRRVHVPEFTYPTPTTDAYVADSPQYLINPGRVPCLASSTFYSPTYVHANRAVALPPHARSHPALHAHDSALRPAAPIRQPHPSVDYWADALHSDAEPGIAGHPARMETLTSSQWSMIDVEAERRAMCAFLADNA